MKLNAAIHIGASGTDASFEDKEGNVVGVKFMNQEITSSDFFGEVIERGADNLKMTPEEMVKSLEVVQVSMPDLVDTIVAQKLGTIIGLIVTEEEDAFVSEKGEENPVSEYVSREMVVSVREEVDRQGRLILAPDREEIRDKVRYLLEHGAGALAVSFKNSPSNPVNEKRVKELIESDYPRHYLGAVPVFISSDFGSEQDDLERTNHCLLNVYCWSGVDDAISKMETYLRERRFVGTFLIAGRNGTAVPRANLMPVNTSGSLASGR